ncbi:hypothetical protein M407DRAFT_145167 [Tulasnella calospora MUT 4182]|uniref:Uncharacterized protein n=1 Tax=Tulasnella calospora MUT 4182 TaxID=1051891 RepID=A0A0C3PX87_9AGAM|nr:hypothetical protein M407DRAFT_145167 [Tulasnella calospora MUT 4182]
MSGVRDRVDDTKWLRSSITGRPHASNPDSSASSEMPPSNRQSGGGGAGVA